MGKTICRAAAAVCLVCLLPLSGCSQTGQAEYTTVHPDVGTIENVVEDTGLVAYRDPFSVIPLVSGKILSCSFEEGDTVAEGAELYIIDSSDLEDQITQAKLSLDSAAEACRQAEEACADLTVTSHAAGSVTAVHVHVGDFVSTGTPIAQVEDQINLTVTLPFAKEDAQSITPGSAAVVTFSSYADSVPGTVKRVYDTTTALAGGREGVNVEISFVNPGVLTSGTIAMARVGNAECMDGAAVGYATAQSIYSTQSGQVLTLPIQVGDAVTVGETVMTIKNESLTNAAANARLSKKSAAVSLAQLEAKREDYIVLSPAGGVVSARSCKAGDFASAAAPMATIVQEQSMCINVPIDEIYIDRIWPGQQAEVAFTTDSGEERTYAASVRRIDENGVTSGGVTDYTVELALEATEGLKAGMNVSVSILTEQKENCLRLPERAVSQGTVQVLREGKPEEVAVETGLTGGGYVEITSGLSESDEVILP